MRLVRIGFDKIIGFLSYEEWKNSGLPIIKPIELDV